MLFGNTQQLLVIGHRSMLTLVPCKQSWAVHVQLERFACVYTSHVSNLSFYSPDKTFRCACAEIHEMIVSSASAVTLNMSRAVAVGDVGWI